MKSSRFPVCSRCKKADFQCVYSTPKARLFEIDPEHRDEIVELPPSLYNRSEGDGFSFLRPAPGSAFGTVTERNALEWWLTSVSVSVLLLFTFDINDADGPMACSICATHTLCPVAYRASTMRPPSPSVPAPPHRCLHA